MGFDLGLLGFVLVAAAVLIAIMRWVFGSSRPRTGRPDRGPGADLGLLIPVLRGTSRADALRAKGRLSANGIRCSLSRLDLDSYDVLVFSPDAEHAAIVLSD